MRRVLMGLQFFPRGGSAHVARNLARRLPGGRLGRDGRLRARSTSPAAPGDARAFYAGLDVRPFDMTARARGRRTRCWPTRRCIPSFEDRPGAPDRVFASLDDATFEHHVARVGARARGRAAPRTPTSCTCTT